MLSQPKACIWSWTAMVCECVGAVGMAAQPSCFQMFLPSNTYLTQLLTRDEIPRGPTGTLPGTAGGYTRALWNLFLHFSPRATWQGPKIAQVQAGCVTSASGLYSLVHAQPCRNPLWQRDSPVYDQTPGRLLAAPEFWWFLCICSTNAALGKEWITTLVSRVFFTMWKRMGGARKMS